MSGSLTPRKLRDRLPWGREMLPSLREEMEDLLARFGISGEEGWFGGALKPSADVAETDKAIEVRMDLPGVDTKEIDIRINNNVLTVSGERKEEKEEKGKTFHRVECRTGSFSRSFTLPSTVADDEVVAEYKDGILSITLPKTQESQPRKIEVKG